MLNLKKQFKDVFKTERGGKHSRSAACIKEGKVFCETVTFFDDRNFWTTNDHNQRLFTDEPEVINLEIISVPIIGE